MEKKITLFIGNLTIGGAERVVVNLANQLSKNGHEVEVLVVSEDGRLVDELSSEVSFSVLPVDRVRWSVIPLARYLRQVRPDSIISFITGVNAMACLAAKLSGVSTQVILTEHNTQSQKPTSYKNRDLALAKYTYRFADHIVGVSDGVSEDVRNWAQVAEDKVTTIYNPVVTEDQIRTTHDQPSHPWFQNDNIKVLLSAGRHVDQKDHPTLIRAFAQLLEDRDQTRLILLGEGKLTPEYETLAKELGIREKLLMPGYVDNIYSHMAHADVFVLSSQYEGLSLVLIEAMACGTTVVSTDCPNGPSEVLNKGEFGELVPVGDPTALKEAIIQSLYKSIKKEKLRNRARDFSISESTRQYELLLD